MAAPRGVGRAPGGDPGPPSGPAPGNSAAVLRRDAQPGGRQGDESQRGRRQAAGLPCRHPPAQEPGRGTDMTHHSADDLSDAIDSWLSREATVWPGYLADVVESLSDSLP